jgi:3-isopropylmalate dehydrogenase
MLKYSFNLKKQSDEIEKAVGRVLDKNLRTADITDKNCQIISTKQMGDAILDELK